MRKKILLAVAASVIAIATISISFGVSHTGLFHLEGPAKIFYGDVGSDAGKWEMVGNVSVSNGGVSELPP